MIRSILGRVALMLLVVWAAMTLAFFALAILPGDAIETQLAQSGVEPQIILERRRAAGLTDPVIWRYARFLYDTIQGDLGSSLLSGEPVTDAILRNLLPTASLAISALIVAIMAGVGLGTVAALRIPGLSPLARLLISLALSMPIYWTGTVAIYVFAAQLGLLPSGGAGRLSQLILPVLLLGYHTAGAIARVTHANIQEMLAADFVVTARAKGLPETRILRAHVLRASLPSVIGVIALQAGFLFSGTVITESLFVRPGIGRLLVQSVIQQDYPVVLGVVIFSAFTYSAANLIADLVTRWIDPRVTL